MHESPLFNQLKSDLPPEVIKTADISDELEALAHEDEFVDFVNTNLDRNEKFVQIPILTIEHNHMTVPLYDARILPRAFRMRDINISLLQSGVPDDWLLAINFFINKRHFCALADTETNEFNLLECETDKRDLRNWDARFGYYLLDSMVNAAGEECRPYKLKDLEGCIDRQAIANTLVDEIGEFFNYQSTSRTKIIRFPDGYGLEATLFHKSDESVETREIMLNIGRECVIPGSDRKIMLAYRYKTIVSGSGLISSRVTRQLVDGNLDDLGNCMNCDDYDQPKMLDPLHDYEAWKEFMLTADRVLSYAMRET